MYNDENNLYHYTYRKDGSESQHRPTVDEQIHSYQSAGGQPPVVDMKPAKKNRTGMKIVALALVCALLGGAAGAGIAVWATRDSGSNTSINVSDRPATQVTVNTVDGKSPMSDAEIYAANVNSVVSINVTGTSGTNIFGQETQTASSGSGFVLTKDGYIVTNNHVIENANTVTVTMYNGDTYDATVIGGDEDYDIGVIKINATDLQTVTLDSSDDLNVGDHVVAIGNPLGELTFSMSEGIASSVNRAINVDGTPFNMIQVTCAINPGNSGGPLLNQFGEVVGIVSAKYSSYASESVEGLGFAIPINDVISMIEDIMTNGYVTNKAYLGATIGTLNQSMAQQYRYSISEGAFIYSVEKGGPADQAGLKLGDVITKIDGTKITSLEELTAAKKGYSAGDVSTLTIYREGQTMTVELTWGAKPAEESDTSTGNSQDSGSNYYSSDDMQDLFEYFFGQFGNRSRGSGTAA